MVNIRIANSCDAEVLSKLAIRSEAHWGYDNEFMERFTSLYRVTEEFIMNNATYILQDGNNILGFYGILVDENETSLEYFFIDPQSIGKGHGKTLWTHTINICKLLSIKELSIVTSPHAKEFYIKMGAHPNGEVESLVKKGCNIPKLRYIV